MYSVCSNCKHPPKKAEDHKRCSRCHITRYCSEQCQKKDWNFHRLKKSLLAPLWPRSRTLRKLKFSATRTCTHLRTKWFFYSFTVEHIYFYLLLSTLTFYRILSWCPLLGVNTEERKTALVPGLGRGGGGTLGTLICSCYGPIIYCLF